MIQDLLSKNYFLPYQIAWITDENRYNLCDKARRVGITYAESYKAVRLRHIIDYARDYWFSSADESASFEFVLDCRLWAGMMNAIIKEILEDLVDDKGYHYNNYVVEFPNGSRINCMTSNPRRFRSKGGDVCLDEFDRHDNPGEMYDAAMPTIKWNYTISIISTRNAEGSEFDNLIKTARRIRSGELVPARDNVLPWSLHEVPITLAVEQGLAEKIYKLDHIDLEARRKFLAECRAECRNEDVYNREYMCIPSTALTSLIPYDLYQSCESVDCLQSLVPHTKDRRNYYAGMDIGREKDLTVIWIDELVGDVFISRKIERLYKTPYAVQLQVASDLLANQNIRRFCGDATGLGDMLVESLQDKFGDYRVEKVKFTNEVKDHLASQILGRFQDKRIRVPADREIRESFHSVRKTVTISGNVRYDAARTDAGHADEFWAAALAKEAAVASVVPEVILL